MALASLNQLKTYLGIAVSDTSQDARLTLILAGVDAWVTKASRDAGVVLSTETITEVLDGPGSHRIFLGFRPVATFTSLYHSDAMPRVFDTTTLVDPTLYILRADVGIIETPHPFSHRHGRINFHRGVQNYKAVYDAGFATAPGDLVAGVVMVSAAFAAGRPGKDGMQSERLGDYSYVRAKVAELPAVEGFLAPYLVRPMAF